MQEKQCSRCKIIKQISEFHSDKNAKTGIRSDCKLCIKDQNKNQKRKKINFTCANCNKTKLIDYYNNKRRKTKYCMRCNSKMTQKGIKKPQFSNENSSRWNGGEYISSDGYKMIKTSELHPSGRIKYKKEHVLVYEKHIGREILTQQGKNGEQVHHIDGNKLNNLIENLILCKNTSEHKKIHCQLQEISYQLVQNGILKFDKNKKEYYIDESRIN